MERLYNNIVLADDYWAKPSEPDDVPYLKNPPEEIDVSVGRQLFVDDFLIEKTELVPKFHPAVKFEGNPILYPETLWEKEPYCPVAAPLSGGIWYDEKEHIYKMWYNAGFIGQMCYATSADGIHWNRPDLDLEPGTNKILLYEDTEEAKVRDPEHYFKPDTTTFFIDEDASDVSQRYKFQMSRPSSTDEDTTLVLGTSADGVHWENFTLKHGVGDCTTMFYNPFRKKWVHSIRAADKTPYHEYTRLRDYLECDSFFAGVNGREKHARWLYADDKDLPNPYIGYRPQLYKVDAVGYESVMVGTFDISYGPENHDCCKYGIPKITEIQLMFSRDGYHFSRPRQSVVGASMHKGAWDRGYVKSVGGVLIVHEDELWIYYSAFAGDERFQVENAFTTEAEQKSGTYRNGATGLAKLRRDGFVSMDGKGSLLTRKLTFSGKESLHINAVGKVYVSILDAQNSVLAVSAPFEGDSTNAKLDFGAFNLSELNGHTIRLRFDVDGELYSFGFADASGDFGGAHAAGVVK